jgi:hypothetical protein
MRYFILAFIIASSLQANGVKLIGNGCDKNSFNSKIIKDIFLGKVTVLNGHKVIAKDSANSKTYEGFTTSVLGRTPYQMKMYWTRMIFTGRLKPLDKVRVSHIEKITPKDNECVLTYIDDNKNIENWESIAYVP